MMPAVAPMRLDRLTVILTGPLAPLTALTGPGSAAA